MTTNKFTVTFCLIVLCLGLAFLSCGDSSTADNSPDEDCVELVENGSVHKDRVWVSFSDRVSTQDEAEDVISVYGYLLISFDNPTDKNSRATINTGSTHVCEVRDSLPRDPDVDRVILMPLLSVGAQ